MKYILSIISIVLLLGISGCGYKEGVATAAQKSYLFFSGNTSNVEVSIDGGENFSIKAGSTNQYDVKPGKHLIEVYRDSRLDRISISGHIDRKDIAFSPGEIVQATKFQLVSAIVDLMMEELGPKISEAIEKAFREDK